MNNSSSIIKVENLSKVFSLRNPQVDELGNTIYEHLALNNVSFEIYKGERVGILGPNGSGKSTLLKILAGVTKPTSGKVFIQGRVASILDIGAGFHQELSGRENVFLNGQIYGISKREIELKFDEILTFSGIEKFIDEPVKNYSNGMYLRLAFSIIVHLDFDVYIFDEVFNVGDAKFALKAKAKLEELSESAKTMVFVSHNMNELLDQDNYILLEKGMVKEKTENKNLLSDYLEDVLKSENIAVHAQSLTITDFSDFPNSEDLKLKRIDFYQKSNKDKFRTDFPFVLEVTFDKLKNSDTIDIVLNISDSRRNTILSSAPFIKGGFSRNEIKGTYTCLCIIPAHLLHSQIYLIQLSFYKNAEKIIPSKMKNEELKVHDIKKSGVIETALYLTDIFAFKPVFRNDEFIFDLADINLQGSLLPAFDWEIAHH